jgi:hypothetical protein
MEQKVGSLKKVNKIDNPLASETKMMKENTQINKIRNKKRGMTKNAKKIQGIIGTTLKISTQIN